MDDKGIESLIQVLSNFNNLKSLKLDLSNNNIDKEGAISLSLALS